MRPTRVNWCRCHCRKWAIENTFINYICTPEKKTIVSLHTDWLLTFRQFASFFFLFNQTNKNQKWLQTFSYLWKTNAELVEIHQVFYLRFALSFCIFECTVRGLVNNVYLLARTIWRFCSLSLFRVNISIWFGLYVCLFLLLGLSFPLRLADKALQLWCNLIHLFLIEFCFVFSLSLSVCWSSMVST